MNMVVVAVAMVMRVLLVIMRVMLVIMGVMMAMLMVVAVLMLMDVIAMGVAVRMRMRVFSRLFAFLRRRSASANRAHHSTSSSFTRISSPPVICT
jgi:hypothetical protein